MAFQSRVARTVKRSRPVQVSIHRHIRTPAHSRRALTTFLNRPLRAGVTLATSLTVLLGYTSFLGCATTDRYQSSVQSRAGTPRTIEHSTSVPGPKNADPTNPYEAAEYFRRERMNEDGTVPVGALLRAQRQRRRMLAHGPAVADAGIDSGSWNWLGPGNVGGRIRSIIVHPTRTNEMLVGSVSGGIWKTTNGGSSWRPINDFLPSLAVGSMAIDPNDAETVYAGTGESFANIQGNGIFKSTDFGETWNPISSTLDSAAGDDFAFVNRIDVHPSDSDTILAATEDGIFRTTDGGGIWDTERFGQVADIDFHPTDGTQAIAGGCFNGQAWYYDTSGPSPVWSAATFNGTPATTTLNSTGSCPGSPSQTLLNVGSTSEFTQGEPITVGTEPTTVRQVIDGNQMCTNNLFGTHSSGEAVTINLTGRVEVAYAAASPNIVYASIDVSNGALFRSTDGGQTYNFVSNLNHMWGQGNYNNALWIDPVDDDGQRMLLGGGALLRSLDGGNTLRGVGRGSHADRHVLVAHPDYDGNDNKIVFQGNDGGIYKATDVLRMLPTFPCTGDGDCGSGQVCDNDANLCTFQNFGWQELNNELGVTQFYHASVNPDTGVVVGGTQDNGSPVFEPAEGTEMWGSMSGGDGGYTASDPTNSSIFYGEYINARVLRSTDGGDDSSYIHADSIANANGGCSSVQSGDIADACSGNANFISPFVMDPNNSSRLLVGAARLWRSNNADGSNPSWSVIKGFVNSSTPNAWGGRISAIAVAEGDADLIWVGHNNGDVFMTENGTDSSPTWEKMDDGTPLLPNRMCLSIAIDRNDHDRVYAAFGGFNADNVWRTNTSDAGTDWDRITGAMPMALPALPVHAVTVHPNQPGWLYVGTDLGIFTSENDGETWSAMNDGPANVIVKHLFWRNNEQLYAATFGRGVYRTDPIVVDCNGNETIDLVDITEGDSDDCNLNFVPDECEADCNDNGTPDDCDLARPVNYKAFTNLTAGSMPNDVTSADFNEDGFPDIAGANWDGTTGQNLPVIINRGEDTGGAWLGFEDVVNYASRDRPAIAWAVASTDLDRDGHLDIAYVAESGEVTRLASDVGVLFGEGDGTFDWPGFTPILVNNVAGFRAEDIAAADVNNDGFDELIVANTEGNDIAVVSNRGENDDGTWGGLAGFDAYTVGLRPVAVGAGRFDLDNYYDLVAVNENGDEVAVLINDGSGSFADAVTYPVETEPTDVAVADLDGDELPDLAVVNRASDTVSILINDGDGTFAPATNIPTGGDAPLAVTVEDYNRDGAPDLAISHELFTGGNLGVLLNRGDGTFRDAISTGGAFAAVELTVADFDQDNDFDVAAAKGSKSSFIAHLPNDTVLDCNDNDTIDSCEIAEGAADVDENGVLDVCEFPFLGDIDNDFDIDLVDFNTGIGCMSGPGGGLTIECLSADTDGDRDVDLHDFSFTWTGFTSDRGGPPHGCCTTGRAGCTDFLVEGCVCNALPECCEERWDQDCVDAVVNLNCGLCVPLRLCGDDTCAQDEDCVTCPEDCGRCAGLCCAAHQTPGCEDSGVQSCVCAVESDCCTQTWSESCAQIASEQCDGCCGNDTCETGETCLTCPADCGDCDFPLCGDTFCLGDEDCITCPQDCGVCPGSCCTAHGTPGCNDPAVQACVCSFEPACCEEAWGQLCAVSAQQCGACLAPPCPDLSAESFVGPTEVQPGQDVTQTVGALIANLGDADAGSFFVGFYLSADPTIETSDTLLIGGRESFNGLAAGNQANVPTGMTIPSDAPTGPMYMGMLVDEFDDVEECTEDNNAASQPVTVVAGN